MRKAGRTDFMPDEWLKVLSELARAEAMTLQQMARSFFVGAPQRCYRTVQGLEEAGLVLVKPNPLNPREKCVLPSQRGLDVVRPGVVGRSLSARRGQAGLVHCILASELRCRLLEHGLPSGSIMRRQEALAALGVQPYHLPIVGLVEVGGRRWALYVRGSRTYRFLAGGIRRLSSTAVAGHLVFYADRKLYGADLTRMTEREAVPSAGFHVYLIESEFEAAVEMIRNPAGWLTVVEERMEAIAPGGRLVKAPRGCPADWLWDRGRNKALLLDLTGNNVHTAALMRNMSLESIRPWGSAAVFLVRDKRHAERWARLLGYHSWQFVMLKDRPPESSLFRLSGDAPHLVPYTPKAVREGAELNAVRVK